MEFTQTYVCDVPYYRIEGEMDHESVPAMHEQMSPLFASGVSHLVLDLRSCEYVDSGGLGVMLTAYNEVKDRGWVGLVAPNANIRRLLEIVGLLHEERFLVFKDEEEARARISAQTSDNESCLPD
jgi:anti-anti-sigma factor